MYYGGGIIGSQSKTLNTTITSAENYGRNSSSRDKPDPFLGKEPIALFFHRDRYIWRYKDMTEYSDLNFPACLTGDKE